MAKYFNYFPKTYYSANNSASLDTVTNLIARFAFESSLKQNSSAFYEYNVQDSDTPELIAYKYYENAERHWIVLLFNDIIDPQFDWPLQYKPLVNYIDTKYSANNYADTANTGITGLTWSMNVNNVKSYFKVITTTNNDDGTVMVDKIELDANTWANTGASTTNYTLEDGTSVSVVVTKEKLSYYDYEQEVNEKKRTIKLLKPDFVPQIEKEFKKIIKQ